MENNWVWSSELKEMINLSDAFSVSTFTNCAPYVGEGIEIKYMQGESKKVYCFGDNKGKVLEEIKEHLLKISGNIGDVK